MKTGRSFRLVLTTLLLLSAASAAAQEEAPDGSDGSGRPAFAGPAFVGVATCEAPLKEFAFITYARDSAVCTTIVSCTNLDSKDRTIVAQFFPGFDANQSGGDATLTLSPGITAEFATKGADPLAIRTINANAGALNFEGKGRICADTQKLACMTTLSCRNAGLQTINMILKNKQLGD